MGAKDSKLSCISYEEAIKRVTQSELRRIKEAFKKSSGSNGSSLSKVAFLQDVLSEGIPPVLADWLYVACGGTQKGIAFKELLCGLVLLTRGTPDEKIKFLWNVYCNDSNTHILKHEFTKALQIESTYQHIQSSGLPSLSHTSILISLFGHSDRVTFEQFKSWILIHEKATVLSKWLLLENGVNLSSELETPTFFQSLAGVTHLEEQDIADLEKVFWSLKGSAKTGQLDLESLGPLITPPVPRAALPGVFLAFDENRDGHIDFKELCCGVSAACRGPTVERSKFCFKVFDMDRDGVLNFNEIKDMIDILIYVAKESSNSSSFRNITAENMLTELSQRVSKGSPTIDGVTETAQQSPSSSTEAIPFSFTQEDFLMWSVQSSLNLVQPFLDLLFEVCHIVLGLRPQCTHLEYDIVKGWLARESSRGYKIGQFWYLISSEWYQQWQHYTQNVSSTPCAFCKSAYTNQRSMIGTDYGVVCDESFTSNSTESTGDLLATADSSSLGSGSSGISFGRSSSGRPNFIDNSHLIAPNPYKSVKTLTGEGGRLKRDIILAEHRDYELVPESLWKALSQWYRGPLPLPRQVIQPPNSPTVELELYPLNLRILRHQNPAPVAQTVSTWGAVAGGYGAMTSAGTYTSTSSAVPSALTPPKRYLAYTAAFSRLATIKQVGDFLCQHLQLKTEDVRLWHLYNAAEIPCLLEEENLTLQELEINDNDQILLEIRNKDLTWPEELGSLSLSQPSGIGGLDRRATLASIQSVHAPGATGLHNLGNTCFMNSALQVLFNTQPLTQYFNQNMHLYELNTTNKLGTKGQLAMRYSELLKEVWTSSTRSVAPLKLRFCMTKYAPQFAGGGQHDSQELLEWLLDGLHEDLNRVTEKPYSELKDSDGRADSIVAHEAWAQHHARNQSIVIDLFYGQLKSKVSCLCCGRDSVRFDPFSLLSLPLPVENYTYCEVLVILLNGQVPVKYGLRLNSESRYIDFKKELSKLCNLDASLMLVCELSSSQIRCVLPDEQKLKMSTATELFVYEIPKSDFFRQRNSTEIGISIENGLKDIQRNKDQHQMTSTSLSSTVSSDEAHGQETPLTKPMSSTANVKPVSDSETSKQTSELSTSPENTFTHQIHRKEGSSVTLLSMKGTTNNNSLDEPNEYPIKSSAKPVESVIASMKYNNYGNTDAVTATTESCYCGSERINDLHLSNQQLNGPATVYDNGGNSSVCDSIEHSVPLSDKCNGKSAITSCYRDGRRTAGNYLIAVHRKMSRQDTYFLSYHKSRPSLFGVPLLIPCYEGGTNKDLYCTVWMQVARLLSPLPPASDQSNHATDCDDSLGYEFPFTLRAVGESGRVCALCPWSRFCRGCLIPCNDEPLLKGYLSSAESSNSSTPQLSTRDTFPAMHRQNSDISFGESPNTSAIHIAIDWDPTALHLRYQSTRERFHTEHESVATCRRQQTEPVDLDHCLRSFTSEEKLEEWYHCAHCKGKKPATKKLQIWKLPPILIVHLKRFNYVNNKWVKSQKVVNFPFKNFDPTPYLASVPQETILRHKELSEQHGTANATDKKCKMEIDDEIGEFDRENFIGSIDENEVAEEAMALDEVDGKDDEQIESSPANGVSKMSVRHSMNNATKRQSTRSTVGRQRLVSSSLTQTPVIDGHLVDYHNHKLEDGQDPYDLKYQLYAVVSHSGMLNGGHYISYASNPNNSWYCYNDSSCREIPCQPNIDPGSAYLLFYERQGLNYSPYLPKVDDKPLPNGNVVDSEESDNELKKLCVIS
ncbi:ubiquitin carboxyl-terminal hydrolase 32 isoform X4 [Bradysia coprophila]|uniref:ubiquitin carboxyl-terminal hydrolase 32 isoform X4 n=1 Tax=Bradysia coprophila TaxID=38358 RepID=UPI00187D7492|nr:ubiquitin carboxyl-terminal hydrolase 32 isoform X4 [Bradysia coprophila]